ncbi:hypothetical protein [Streptomyces capitiformicae]|uniref:hypothetical protein n=1 Tax=Streptomyces capitiformicae TaxID=2014920 RepID=UPI001675490B|nr:hypothetical protein [Streptomyces capitiformicae]
MGDHVRPYEALLGVRRVVGRCGCELIPTTLGSKSMSSSRSRSSHDSKPTCRPVVAARYQLGK